MHSVTVRMVKNHVGAKTRERIVYWRENPDGISRSTRPARSARHRKMRLSVAPRYKTARMETVIRILIIGVLVAIVASLGSALFHLSRKAGDSGKVARDLTIRIALSVALFILLMIAWHLGLIAP